MGPSVERVAVPWIWECWRDNFGGVLGGRMIKSETCRVQDASEYLRECLPAVGCSRLEHGRDVWAGYLEASAYAVVKANGLFSKGHPVRISSMGV